MCISQNSPDLLRANAEGSGTAAESPFVVVITTSGIKVLDHIVNAVVLTSAFSSGNEATYASSRSLFMLSQQGKAPRFFAKVLRNGVPIYALLLTSLFGCFAYLMCGHGRSTEAFNWLLNITAVGSMLTWCGIALSHIRFTRAMRVQGLSRDVLPFKSWVQPWGAYVVLVSFLIIIFFSGWTTLQPWSAADFFSVYINIPIVAVLYVGWKVAKKTRIVPLAEMDL